MPTTESSYHKNILLGRSIYYGFLLYSGALLDNFWLPAVVQALITGLVIVGAARHLVDPQSSPARFAAVNLALFGVGAATSLPFFVSFLMPDLFAGLLIVAAAVMVAGWKQERMAWRLFWIALLCLGALFHSSNSLLLACLAVIMLIGAALARSERPWRPVGMAALAMLIGIFGELAFASALEQLLDRNAIRPPFLSARLVADGPGEAYLRRTCPQNGFVLCDYRERMPGHSDTLLWSRDSQAGIFTAAPSDVQVRMAAEDKRFAFNVLVHEPMWTASTALRNALTQAADLGLEEFNGPLDDIADKIPSPVVGRVLRSRANHGEMPVAAYRAYVWPMTLAGLAVLIFAFVRGREQCWRAPITVIVLGIAANAFICGALSGANARYQERVIWIIPMAAVGFLLARRPAWDTQTSNRRNAMAA